MIIKDQESAERFGEILRVSENGNYAIVKSKDGDYLIIAHLENRWRAVDSWKSLDVIKKFWAYHTGEKIESEE